MSRREEAGVNSDDEVRAMSTDWGWMQGGGGVIGGSEKSGSWLNHSAAEDRNRTGDSEPEAMALMTSRCDC